MNTPPATRAPRAALSAFASATLVLAGCGQQQEAEGTPTGNETPVTDPVVTTYEGGLYLIDGESLELVEDIELDGFNRLNPAGDDRHVLVTTPEGFRVLDAVGAELTDDVFAAEEGSHVVNHAGRTVLFADGTGEVTIFDPEELGDGLPVTETHTTPEPHHGVAIELSNGELVVTEGDEERGTGITVLDADGEEIASSDECPGVHGEATARDEVVVIGCEDGVLVYRDGEITKVESPTEYGRIGNQAGTEESPIVLGDYKQDPDAELERPEVVSLIDTETGELELVELDASYTFRSLARGPHGAALVLGTDGAIHVIDPESAEVTETIQVLEEEWEEPEEWQDPRPAIFVRGVTAYVSDPAGRQLHAIDLESGEIARTLSLEEAPNELSGVVAG